MDEVYQFLLRLPNWVQGGLIILIGGILYVTMGLERLYMAGRLIGLMLCTVFFCGLFMLMIYLIWLIWCYFEKKADERMSND